MNQLWLYLILIVVLAIIWYWRLDTDYGKYRDSFRTIDKREHLAAAFTLVLLITATGISAIQAAVATLIAGILLEVVQKIPSPLDRRNAPSLTYSEMWATSWRDIVADAVGVIVAGAWVLLWRGY